jgi:hypothetical protein
MDRLTVETKLEKEATEERPASPESVNLTGATIEGNLSLNGATITAHLNMNSLKVGTYMQIDATEQHPASLESVELVSAKIEGQLSLAGATIKNLNMNSLTVGTDLLMQHTGENEWWKEPAPPYPCFKSVNLTFASIKQNLELRNATFDKLDLTSTRIEGELRLGKFADRSSKGCLTLYNTHANAIQDWWIEGDWKNNTMEVHDCWPKHLKLDGFTYDRLFEFDGRLRPVEWCIQWLERDRSSYSPGRYEAARECTSEGRGAR